MVSYASLILLLSMTLFILTACDEGKTPEKTSPFPTLSDIADWQWNKLSEKRIFYGHQSVGYNILEGIKDLSAKSQQIKINVVQASNPSEIEAASLIHFWIGNNTQPRSKINAFYNYMAKAIKNSPDIALFKFCFVDFEPRTDVKAIFDEYRNTMSHLKESFPNTTFIHVTVPLTCTPIGIKGWIRTGKNVIKRIMGRPVFDLSDNTKRYQFNELMRKEYTGRDLIFDLAKIESTFPDGTRPLFSANGKTYYSLVPYYTYDGGHLNELGRRIVAEQLLIILAGLSK